MLLLHLLLVLLLQGLLHHTASISIVVWTTTQAAASRAQEVVAVLASRETSTVFVHKLIVGEAITLMRVGLVLAGMILEATAWSC